MILVIDCGSSKTPHIVEYLQESTDVEVMSILDIHEAPDPSKFKGVVFSGAPILITEVDPSPYLTKTEWILTTPLPILGICFGHQLIGLHHGALANRMKEDRDIQEIEILVDCPLFDRMPNILHMMEDHCETISIPKDFIHVGVSDACVNEAMMHKTKPIYGVQFHPEVSGMQGSLLFENFVDICFREDTVTS